HVQQQHQPHGQKQALNAGNALAELLMRQNVQQQLMRNAAGSTLTAAQVQSLANSNAAQAILQARANSTPQPNAARLPMDSLLASQLQSLQAQHGVGGLQAAMQSMAAAAANQQQLQRQAAGQPSADMLMANLHNQLLMQQQQQQQQQHQQQQQLLLQQVASYGSGGPLPSMAQPTAMMQQRPNGSMDSVSSLGAAPPPILGNRGGSSALPTHAEPHSPTGSAGSASSANAAASASAANKEQRRLALACVALQLARGGISVEQAINSGIMGGMSVTDVRFIVE
ncbi:MAG: hypothetical protein ACT6T3_21900, partial [Agrobacterium sp.]|uniref:hypothetical protein n=1 Tax=Agrobacterium sp. TaxID=361 RepID=UPI0040336CB8